MLKLLKVSIKFLNIVRFGQTGWLFWPPHSVDITFDTLRQIIERLLKTLQHIFCRQYNNPKSQGKKKRMCIIINLTTHEWMFSIQKQQTIFKYNNKSELLPNIKINGKIRTKTNSAKNKPTSN